MAFSAKSFLRKVGVERTRRYFERECPSLAVDPSVRAGERYCRALEALDHDARQTHLFAFERLRAMTSDVARYALQRGAASAWGEDDPRTARARELTSHELVMDLFLDAPRALELAEELFDADSLTQVQCYRATQHVSEIHFGEQQRCALAAALTPVLVEHVGGRIVVEDHALDDRLMLFVYFEQSLRAVEEIVVDHVETRAMRPVVKLALVFSQQEQRLRVHAPGAGQRALDVARRSLGALLVGDESLFTEDGSLTDFDFRPIVEGKTTLSPCALPVSQGRVSEMSVVVPGGIVTLKPTGDMHAFVRETLRPIVLAYMVRHVQITFTLLTKRGRARRRTITLRWPGSTNLRTVMQDRLLENELRRWGILRDASVQQQAA